MALLPGTIKPASGSRKTVKRLGGGNSSGHGTSSSRGGKGQTARSGGKSRTHIRAFRPSLLKIPKVRGFHSRFTKRETVSLTVLEKVAKEKILITPAFLAKAGVVSHPENGVKIMAVGVLTKKLEIKDCFASQAAVEKIEKAGGKISF